MLCNQFPESNISLYHQQRWNQVFLWNCIPWYFASIEKACVVSYLACCCLHPCWMAYLLMTFPFTNRWFEDIMTINFTFEHDFFLIYQTKGYLKILRLNDIQKTNSLITQSNIHFYVSTPNSQNMYYYFCCLIKSYNYTEWRVAKNSTCNEE